MSVAHAGGATKYMVCGIEMTKTKRMDYYMVDIFPENVLLLARLFRTTSIPVGPSTGKVLWG